MLTTRRSGGRECRVADELLVMHQGQAVEYGNADAIYANPQHEYTKKLLAAIPGR
jgi:peptide/nickel transport system ATP-binding protein